ncbi:MAG: GGDEF domain-containing protein [Candidatus Thiodiazotropha sp. 6PLUC2]
MATETISAVSKGEWKALLLQEEKKTERYANYIRLLLTLLYLGVAFTIKDEIPSYSFNAIISSALISCIYGLLVFNTLRTANPPRWIKYSSISIDIILLSIVIYSFGSFRSFKTEAFLLYYLWIGLSTLRFSPRLTFTAGALSTLSYLLIVWLAINNNTIELGTITEEFTSDRVSSLNIILRLLFLSSFIALSVYTAYIFRVIAARALSEQLLEVRNHEMSNTLDQLRKTQKQLATKNRELATLSEIDMLSQLYNRRKIDEIMREALVEVIAQPTTSLSLILLDIDLFKSYNDSHGHLVGDQVIRKVAELLMKSARGNDYIGRWGGEEFIIICKQKNAHDASIIAERLRRTIETTTLETVGSVTCSFGVSQYRRNDGADSLLKRADEALYHSKESGRNRVSCIY